MPAASFSPPEVAVRIVTQLKVIAESDAEVFDMNGVVSCEYNMDNGCIELKFVDGTEIAIDCTTVENLTSDNMYERSELDYLIYNDPLAYAHLILNGDPETY